MRRFLQAHLPPKRRSIETIASPQQTDAAQKTVFQDEDAAMKHFLNISSQSAARANPHWEVAFSIFGSADTDTDGLIARLLFGWTRFEFDPTQEGDVWTEKTIPFLGRQLMVTVRKPGRRPDLETQIRNTMLLDYVVLAYDSGSQESFDEMLKIHAEVTQQRLLAKPQRPWLGGLIVALDTGKSEKVHSVDGLELARTLGFGFHAYVLGIREGCNKDDLEPFVRSLLVQALEKSGLSVETRPTVPASQLLPPLDADLSAIELSMDFRQQTT